MSGGGSPRKILLAVREGHTRPRLFSSALELCRRLDAEMDIVLVTDKRRPPVEIDAFLDSLRQAGLQYSLHLHPGLRRRDIVDYANSRECITAVIIDSREGWEPLARDRTSDPWRRLACPLVSAVTDSYNSKR
jgi:hypothetical protein